MQKKNLKSVKYCSMSAGSGKGAERRTDLDIAGELFRVAIDSLEFVSIDRDQSAQKSDHCRSGNWE